MELGELFNADWFPGSTNDTLPFSRPEPCVDNVDGGGGNISPTGGYFPGLLSIGDLFTFVGLLGRTGENAVGLWMLGDRFLRSCTLESALWKFSGGRRGGDGIFGEENLDLG